MINPVEVVDAIPGHIRELGANMRDADAREAENLGFIPHRILWRSYKKSIFCKTCLINGKVVAIWGVCGTPLSHTGQPWLITSNDITALASPIDFAILYRQEVRKMKAMFPLLENWVDSTYTEAVRLMRIVGFNIDNPMPHGKKGALFNRFWLST